MYNPTSHKELPHFPIKVSDLPGEPVRPDERELIMDAVQPGLNAVEVWELVQNRVSLGQVVTVIRELGCS